MAETFFDDKILSYINSHSNDTQSEVASTIPPAEEVSSLILTTATDVPSQPPSAGDGTSVSRLPYSHGSLTLPASLLSRLPYSSSSFTLPAPLLSRLPYSPGFLALTAT